MGHMKGGEHSLKNSGPSKFHQWFKSYGHFTEGVDLAYWWSCIGKSLRLQHAQQACLKKSFNDLTCDCFYFWYNSRGLVSTRALNRSNT